MCPVGRSCSYEERQEFARFPFFLTTIVLVCTFPNLPYASHASPQIAKPLFYRYDEEHGVRDAFKAELEKVRRPDICTLYTFFTEQ